MPVSPGISAQFAPAASQRCHWREVLIAGVPDHEPSSAVSVSPSRSVPLTDGSAVLTGGAAAITPVTDELALTVPGAALSAVTTTRSV